MKQKIFDVAVLVITMLVAYLIPEQFVELQEAIIYIAIFFLGRWLEVPAYMAKLKKSLKGW